MFRSSEPQLAKWGSELIGSVERRFERVNLRADVSSRGQDGVSLSDDTRMSALVLPVELQQLEDFKAFLNFGGFTTYLKMPYTRQLKLQPGYVPRANDAGSDLRGEGRVIKSEPTETPDTPNTAPATPARDLRPRSGGSLLTDKINFDLGRKDGSDKRKV